MYTRTVKEQCPTIFGKSPLHQICFGLFIVSAMSCIVASSLHYTEHFTGNSITWKSWLLSIVFLLMAHLPSSLDIRQWIYSIDSKILLVLAVLSVVFLVSHFWNYQTSPWNENGLFDDAAWDIWFAKKYVVSEEPFQAAFFTNYHSKEVGFHYYIVMFFRLLGYDIQTFNISLIVLGLISLCFTALLVQRLFGSYVITIIVAILLNFLPTFFVQTFVGHRYAMATPLIMSSLYFLYTGFQDKSCFRTALSSILGALCIGSAIMGKQFVIALFASLCVQLLLNYKKTNTASNRGLLMIFTIGLFASLVPMLSYIYYNVEDYVGYEQRLMQQFIESFSQVGERGVFQAYFLPLLEMFFNPNGGKRLWTPDVVLLPFSYLLFVVPGIFIAFTKRRYEIILLAVVPIAGSLVAGAYDFRVLHAVPFLMILLGFSLSKLSELQRTSIVNRHMPSYSVMIAATIVLLLGLIPCVSYLNEKSKDPYSVAAFAQHEVATARFVKDIVAGATEPSTAMRKNEFVKLLGVPEPDYETLVCFGNGYGIPHLFLQDYGDRKIMSFCDQINIIMRTEEQIVADNKTAIEKFASEKKDLKLVWGLSEKTEDIIKSFRQFKGFGSEEILTANHAGRSFTFYVLNIKGDNVLEFKEALKVTKIL